MYIIVPIISNIYRCKWTDACKIWTKVFQVLLMVSLLGASRKSSPRSFQGFHLLGKSYTTFSLKVIGAALLKTAICMSFENSLIFPKCLLSFNILYPIIIIIIMPSIYCRSFLLEAKPHERRIAVSFAYQSIPKLLGQS